MTIKRSIFLCMSAFSFLAFAQVSSDTGSLEYSDGGYEIKIVLLNNLNAVKQAWDTPGSTYIPGTGGKRTFKPGDSVVPFIAFTSSFGQTRQLTLKANFDLVKPDGTYSAVRDDNVKIADAKIKPKVFYRAANFFGWSFDGSDARGEYRVEILVFDNYGFSEKFILSFELTD